LVNNAAVCVADTNIPQDSLEHLATNASPPLFVETISMAKVNRVANTLGKLHTLKTDQTEAPYLLGYSTDDEASIRRAMRQLLEQGVKNVYMHLPAENKVVCASGKQYFVLAYHSQKVINKNGARDSFMAALVWAHMQGLGFEESAHAGVAAASLCAAAHTVVNDKLSAEYLCKAVENYIKQ
jgi:pseudouridine kinase